MEHQFKEAMGIDLAGFRIGTGHYLQQTHGLMGFFPVILQRSREMIVCADAALLDLLEPHLRPTRHHASSDICLLHPERRIAWFLGDGLEPTRIHARLFSTRDEIEAELAADPELAKHRSVFVWAPGLY